MPNAVSQTLSQMIFIVPLIVIMVIMFRSNKKKAKAVQDMIASIQPGVKVKTIGGFYGKVVSVKEDVVTIECGPDKAKLIIDKGAIATIQNNDTVNDTGIENK